MQNTTHNLRHRFLNKAIGLVQPPKVAIEILLSWAIKKAKEEGIGVGSIIYRWTDSVGIKARPHCPCKALAKEMDQRGIDYIESHYKTEIKEILKERTEAQKKIDIEKKTEEKTNDEKK